MKGHLAVKMSTFNMVRLSSNSHGMNHVTLVWGSCGGVGVNRKWSKISLGVMCVVWVLPGSDMGLVWGLCGGVGVSRKWYKMSLGFFFFLTFFFVVLVGF